jgi:hypothetical protein
VRWRLPARDAKYPPLAEYMMPEEAETALAKSAAPATISAHATGKVLAVMGYRIMPPGYNGFVCLVMGGFPGAPTFSPAELRGLVYDAKTRAPVCFDPEAMRVVLPSYELQTRLGLAGEPPDRITEAVQAAYSPV